MFRINYDFFDNPVVPDYVLTKSNKERIGVIKCTEKTITSKFNDLDEINFTTNLYIDENKNPIYDEIEEMKYVYLPDIGFFAITSVDIDSEGTTLESKTVNAKSYECLLAQKYLENFVINMGTTESIDGVQLLNLADKSKSLLHLVLEKCPDWEIGHVDIALQTMQRSFEVTRQDVYSFLMEDMATAFECVFLFNTLNNTINVYKEENVGEDTDIYVSYNNLLKTASASLNTDDIKTCLTLTGGDDLTVREVNMGYDRIYNFEYYNSTRYMSSSLYASYNEWKNLRNSKLDTYNNLLSQYQNYYSQINYITNEKMPSTSGSTNWTEYGLVPLQEQLSAYEQKQAVMMKSGWGESSSPYYTSTYLPVYNTIQDINKQIKAIESQIANLKSSQDAIYSQMQEIMNLVSMENNFSEEELKELSTFIREDELSSDNYIVTDSMTDEERFDMLNDFLEFGEEELAKVAVPQFSFSADLSNLFVIPEFKRFNGYFTPGNYIHVAIRDDYIIKSRLLTMSFDFYNIDNFSVTFGNYVKTSKNMFTDITEAINMAKSAATSVSFNQSYWNQASKDTDDIGKAIEAGLLSAGKYLKNGDNSEMLIDDRGIFVNTVSGQYAGLDSIFIGGGRILFTDDNWKTVSEAIGRVNIKGQSVFGVIAQAMLSGYIGASTIEGGTITGSDFNNGNGTFHVDENGNLTANSATVKGEIKADSGYIGGENGFTITSGKLYSGNKSSFSSSVDGVYIGTNGIKLGNTFSVNNKGYIVSTSGKIGGFDITNKYIANGTSSLASSSNSVYLGTDGISLGTTFSVTKAGVLTSTNGTIGGWTIGKNKISSSGIDISSTGFLRATNGNWRINSDGSATFKNVYITGVKDGSSFGGITYSSTSGTYGNFNDGFYANSSFGLKGGALSDFNNLVVGTITADYIKTAVLNAGFITADEVSANYATITSLNAANATINNLKTSNISCDRLVAGEVNGHSVDWRQITYISDIDCREENINGEDYLLIKGYKSQVLYTLC